MKRYAWYICICAILMLFASPFVLADTWTEEGGDNDGYGGGGGYGYGSSATASAGASGNNPYSMGYASGWKSVYTDTAGWFGCNSSCYASGYGCVTDNDGSGAFGGGGGDGSAPCGSAYASAGVSSSGVGSWEDYDHDPGCNYYELVYLDAFGCVSASCSAGASGSVPEGSQNFGSGSGNGSADVSI